MERVVEGGKVKKIGIGRKLEVGNSIIGVSIRFNGLMSFGGEYV